MSIKIALVFIACTVFAEGFWVGKTIDRDEVAKRWGKQSFSAEKFKEGSMSARAAMAYDLLSNQKAFLGKAYGEIESSLGMHDGHYFNDSIPAYLIFDGDTAGKHEAWQLVFLPDKSRKISKIVVHKNCCE